ncbi:MAG: efflux RND transporter permease subunit, partial [Pseudomonadota bacterium]
MLSEIFISRPRLAVVLSLLVVILGALSVSSIPVAQYPAIAPPTVQIYATYPGATAETVEQTVAQPLENALNGVPGMKYMQSSSSADGSYSLTAAFDIGADIELAALAVQDRISTALLQLPADVRRGGVSVTKASGDLLMAFALVSPDASRDELFLSNYLKLNVLDRLSRIEGVGEAMVFGERDYAMRIWLDPARLQQLSITMGDVIQAIETQNLQAAVGGIGVPPVPTGQQIEMRISGPARLASPEAFNEIVLRAGPGSGLVRLGDVARVELGAESEASIVRFAGGPAAGVGINRAPGANAVNVAAAVMAEIEALRPSLPSGTQLRLVLNTADFVDRMIYTVVTTLMVAFALVAGVVLVFLGRLRTTLIPLIAVPVSVIGAVATVYALGFSGNAITLLALILAIGIVVDDAILVVENVERVMEDNPSLTPAEAARQAMHEITPSIVGITLVLLAVLVPVAFLPGSSGVLFQQFAAVVAGAVVISALNALTLSPALSAALLRPGRPPLLLRATSGAVQAIGVLYGAVVRRLIWLAPLGLVAAVAAGMGAYQLYQSAPKGFLPAEDKGFLFVIMSLPAGASLERTDAVSRQAEKVLAADPAIDAAMTVLGVDYLAGGSSPSAGVFFVKLKDPETRTDPSLSSFATANRLNGALAAIPGASFIAANPPTVSGLGRVGGLDYVLEARRGQSLEELQATALGIAQAARAEPAIAGVFGGGGTNAPRLALEIDRQRAALLGISLPDAFVTMQGMLGGIYVNDFNLYGRTWSVMVQAEGTDRVEAADALALNVRASTGALVPIDSFA